MATVAKAPAVNITMKYDKVKLRKCLYRPVSNTTVVKLISSLSCDLSQQRFLTIPVEYSGHEVKNALLCMPPYLSLQDDVIVDGDETIQPVLVPFDVAKVVATRAGVSMLYVHGQCCDIYRRDQDGYIIHYSSLLSNERRRDQAPLDTWDAC